MAHFIWNTIHTTSLKASIDFYTTLVGLKIEREFTSPLDVQYVFMADDRGFEIELISQASPNECSAPSNLSLGFEVPNLDVMIDAITTFGLSLEGEVITVPHTRFCFVKDPNGITIQFVERS